MSSSASSKNKSNTRTAEEEKTKQAGPFVQAVNDFLNLFFSLTWKAGFIRFLLFCLFGSALFILMILSLYPLAEWPTITFKSSILGRILVLIAPFLFARGFASIFLDDVYELNDVGIARKFITRAAFSFPFFDMIHIEKGEVRESDKRSPIFRIGGPGRVQVSLENVAIFEKVDGTPNPIGPTKNHLFYSQNIDGFERLRQAFDIRDQTISIDRINARTKDGIPLSIHNIRLLFSVYRSSSDSTLETPYPYSEEAILSLVYDQAKEPWRLAFTGLVRATLIRFISNATLAEIFATVGEPEIQRQIQKQQNIQAFANKRRLADFMGGDSLPSQENQQPDEVGEIPPLETVQYEIANQIGASKVPRLQISQRFYDRYVRGFPAQASARGVRLEWIDVGTWQPAPSASSVLVKHEEAFRISSENLVLGNRAVLDDLCHEEQASELLRLIRQPIYRFYQMMRDGEERPEIVANLVEEFLGVLRAARDDFEQDNTAMPASVQQALEHIARYRRDDFNRTDHHSI